VLARDDNRIAANLDVVDSSGRICVRFEGWEDRQFDLPEPVLRYLVAPGEVMLSQLWREPLEGWGEGRELQLYALDGGLFPAGFFEGYGGIWMQVLAQAILSRREREVWKQMEATTKRRKDWLLGRIVAKDALRQTLAERGLALAPADIEIMADANGKPVVQGMWTSAAGGAPALSLSHTEGMAVALVGSGPGGLGVDVEPLERLDEWQYHAVFTVEEQALLAAVGEQSAGEWPLRLWCAKEAVAKARGQDSVSIPSSLLVVDCNAATGEVRVRVRDRQRDQVRDALAADSMMAHTCRSHGFVIAAAIKTTKQDREC
jgi:phosphopantetheinyl transferase